MINYSGTGPPEGGPCVSNSVRVERYSLVSLNWPLSLP
jgi:hypothetical protein